MNFILIPSLEHIALVKIAITLWNQQDIRAFVTEPCFPLPRRETREWKKIEDTVIEKIPKLQQPEPLKEEILGFLKPIGMEILKWMEYSKNNSYFGIALPDKLCWTPQGTVDRKKTAQVLIRDESLDITTRYRLACINCLENDIRELWNSMSQEKKAALYIEGRPSFFIKEDLVVLWTYYIKGEVAKLNGLIQESRGKEMSPYQFAFEFAAREGNKAATEYFLQKLSPREREESLVTCARNVAERGSFSYINDFIQKHCADVLFFLLSQMDEEQQREVFKSHPFQVLKCLLEWPWQSLFLETANRMWDFLSGGLLADLLLRIIDKVERGYKVCNYQKLFGELWQQSPVDHRRYVMNEKALFLLLGLLGIRDEKHFKMILKDATLVKKEKLILGYTGYSICKDLIDRNEWDFLEFFIRECVSSKKVMIKFKKEFKKNKLLRDKDKLDKFHLLLDNIISGYDNKRRTMEV